MLLSTVILKCRFSEILLLVVALVDLCSCFLDANALLVEAFKLVVLHFDFDLVVVVGISQFHKPLHIVWVVIQGLDRVWIDLWVLKDILLAWRNCASLGLLVFHLNLHGDL